MIYHTKHGLFLSTEVIAFYNKNVASIKCNHGRKNKNVASIKCNHGRKNKRVASIKCNHGRQINGGYHFSKRSN